MGAPWADVSRQLAENHYVELEIVVRLSPGDAVTIGEDGIPRNAGGQAIFRSVQENES
jgi:hypothetical protein